MVSKLPIISSVAHQHQHQPAGLLLPPFQQQTTFGSAMQGLSAVERQMQAELAALSEMQAQQAAAHAEMRRARAAGPGQTDAVPDEAVMRAYKM